MNLKKMMLIFFIFLALALCIGSVSAENSTIVGEQDQIQENEVPGGVTQNTDQNDTKPVADTQPAVVKKPTRKIDTDADADDVVVEYKKNNYLKVKVKNDDTYRPIKNLKLKVKVFTKSKSKTYTIKTDSKGIAKFNTKNLKLGDHKVVITSADDKYKVYEKANIFVGKKYTATLKPNSKLKLKNKDVIRVYTRYDEDDKEIRVSFKGVAKKSNILKAEFYFKNKYTGKIIKKVEYSDFDNGRWQYPDEEYSYRFTPVKVKITYVTV